jgi:invasion protein IalB
MRSTCAVLAAAKRRKAKIAPLAFALALSIGGAAIAQEPGSGAVPKTPPAGAVPKAPSAPAAKPDTPKGEGAGGEAQPQTSIVGNYGEWALVCAIKKDETGRHPCSLAQALVERESQKLVFRVIFTHGPKGDLVLQVDGPTGIALQRGLEFSPDTKKVYRLPFQTCIPRGCRAVMVVENDLKGELQASKKGSLTVFALNGQAVRTSTDLSGLTEGLAALDQRRRGK